jgi:hypothetical protein
MSARRHVAAQVRIYKKHDINLGTYHKHTKPQPNTTTKHQNNIPKHLKPQKKLNKKSKKTTVQQTNTN